MKKIFLIILVAITSYAFSYAQAIDSEKVFGGYKFSQNGEKMSFRDLERTMEANESAHQLINYARSRNMLASVISFAGGGLIGWPIGSYLGGGDPNWALAGIGIGLVVVSIPISSSAGKKAKRAVDIYNDSLEETSFHAPKPRYNFIVNGSRVGFLVTF